MNKYDVITGKRFFKYNPDTDVTNAFRVIKVLNENKIECKDESNDKVFTLNKKGLSEYNALIPDALYCISLVSTSKAQNDIILYVMRKEDMEKSIPVPNIIGRQMILNDKNVDKIILGDYITNAIENKELSLFLSASKVHSTIMINSYLDDSIEDIENLLSDDKNKINRMMKNNFNNFKANSLKHEYHGEIYGPESIHDLLAIMQKDIDASLGISSLDPNTLSKEEFELFVGAPYTNLSVVEYKKDIDLDKIQSNYFLSRFEDGKVYVVSYSLISEDLLK